jgi:hypothetical protein
VEESREQVSADFRKKIYSVYQTVVDSRRQPNSSEFAAGMRDIFRRIRRVGKRDKVSFIERKTLSVR